MTAILILLPTSRIHSSRPVFKGQPYSFNNAGPPHPPIHSISQCLRAPWPPFPPPLYPFNFVLFARFQAAFPPFPSIHSISQCLKAS